MIKVIVAGGRDFNDFKLLTNYLDFLLGGKEATIVCGEARGADLLGRKYAELRGLPIDSYPADWDAHGKAAGYKRNTLMAENATHLVAFWDGQSRGTSNMINLAYKMNLESRVKSY